MMTKEMMIKQGYVPPTCTMPEPPAGMLILAEVHAGRNPCWGCNMDREKCKGAPKQDTP